MQLIDIVRRTSPPEPWSEGDNIPWNEPAFSERMLREHLSQEHDAASRRTEKIDAQVAWLHREVLHETPTRVLELGSGPGLYTSRLAALGHACRGIDFSPASIAYAREQAAAAKLDCVYDQADMRVAEYGTGFGLVMQIFGDFNVFKPADARLVLRKAWDALAPGGTLLLEPHTEKSLRKNGASEASWQAPASGLFSDKPHLYLQEAFWDEAQSVATRRFYIVDAATGAVMRSALSYQAYTDQQYLDLLTECGFEQPRTVPSLVGEPDEWQEHFVVVIARKPAA